MKTTGSPAARRAATSSDAEAASARSHGSAVRYSPTATGTASAAGASHAAGRDRAGALAQRYALLGGDVRYHGKPHASVYDATFALLGGVARSRILAVGDGIRTDILGANLAGIASAFIAGGVHGEELGVAIRVGREVLATEHAYPERVVELHFFECELLGEPTPLLRQQMNWVERAKLRHLSFPPADDELIDLLELLLP